MPVFNGEEIIRSALSSLLQQSFQDFELIISDNASTDGTERICREYAKRDQRIQYIRQPINLGAAANFKFVLDEARGEYFMWSACDDVRSPDFIELNLSFLSENPEYVASTSPNGFEGEGRNQPNLIGFGLDGEVFERFIKFFEYCWVSHGIFYALIRTQVLKECKIVGESFLAADWAIDLYLASRGKIHRASTGAMFSGVKGISSGNNAFKAFRNHAIEWLFPFYRLNQYVMTLSTDFSFLQRGQIMFIMIRLSMTAIIYQLRVALRSVR